MIRVENLSKYYNTFPAVKDLSFEIKEGEIVGLLGLNGSGKTSSLRILSGFLLPSSGKVLINGIDSFKEPLQTKKLIGYLPETPPLYEDLSLKDYLTFVARIKGIPDKQIDSAIDKVLIQTDTKDVQHKRLAHFSLGYKKRAGIAQALLASPRVLILDEPISGLDPGQIFEMRKLIKSFSGKHTVLISSHILSELYKTCDRFLFIKEGCLVYDLDHESLDLELEKLSRLIISLGKGDREICESFLKGLETTFTFEFLSESFRGFNFLIQAKEEENFKFELIHKLSQSNLSLEALYRQELSLEDIFNRVHS
ncbi:MAG: ABC transporter ATP-binding protein [Leptospiraceae bacterium]|nr:ABC transporter ATP-binding protein [Leptospiraceae bacterium]